MKEWEALSDWYDEKQGETGDLWHIALIDPALLRLVGDPRGRDILDLGCGNGYLSRRLARCGARMTAIDSSRRMLEHAKSRDSENSLKITYIHSEANRLDSIQKESFDLVFANMSLMDIEDAEGSIKEVSRVLRRGGRLVASLSHPCFDTGSNSAWLSEKVFSETRMYRKVRAYRRPFSEKIPWRLPSGGVEYTVSFHRPLGWYVSVLRTCGLTITALEEPEPTAEFLDKESDAPGFLEVPLHLVFEAAKM